MNGRDLDAIRDRLGARVVAGLTDEDLHALTSGLSIVRSHSAILRQSVGSAVDLTGTIPPEPPGMES